MKLTQHIEAILFYKNEPVPVILLSRLLNEPEDRITAALRQLQESYAERGIVIVFDGEHAEFGTHPDTANIIEAMHKEEFSKELSKAALEALSIVLYKGPVSRREIDHIRGVNSGFILRSLLIRGLIERAESATGERSGIYKPTLELLRHLGLTRAEDLPEFAVAFKQIEEFQKQKDEEAL